MPGASGPAGADDADDLALIAEAAEEAGRMAMGYWRNDPETWFKDGGSPVCEADIALDRHLREELRRARPAYGWVSEETEAEAAHDDAARGRAFVVDPIDGTRAFLSGRETWGVAVAVIEDGRPIAGALACPALGHLYLARRGAGATRDGERIGVRGERDRPLMAGPRSWLRLMPDGYGNRVESAPYVPSLAYRIARVAEGTLDGTYVRASAHDWDLAASDIVLGEAGGSLLRQDGRPPIYGRETARHGLLVAGSAAQLPHMLSMVRQVPDDRVTD